MARKTGLGRGLGAIFGTDVVESVEESLHQPEKREENHVSRETSGRKTVHTAGQTVHKKHENTGNALFSCLPQIKRPCAEPISTLH